MSLRLRSYVLILVAGIGINIMASQPVEAASILFGLSGAGNAASSLYTIDTTTGAATLVGATGFSNVTGFAYHPSTGVFYGVANGATQADDDLLITINRTTGAGTQVAKLTPVPAQAGSNILVSDMAFSPSEELFAWNEDAPDQIATINKTTGVFENKTPGNVFTTIQNGLAFNSAGTLYLKAANSFWTVNTTTGLPTFVTIAPGNADMFNALAFNPDDGVAYSLDRSAALVRLNSTLTHSDIVGLTGVASMDSLAFVPDAAAVPEPGSLLLLGTGVGALVRRRRRAAVKQS